MNCITDVVELNKQLFEKMTDETKYSGQLDHDNKKNGIGVCLYPDGSVYYGEWKNNIKEGYGIFTDDNNRRWDGQWKNNTFVYGVYYSCGMLMYEGKFTKVKNGNCVLHIYDKNATSEKKNTADAIDEKMYSTSGCIYNY